MEKPVHTGGCPGSALKEFARSESNYSESDYESKLKQWPVQIKLVPVNAPYFNDADILVAQTAPHMHMQILIRNLWEIR